MALTKKQIEKKLIEICDTDDMFYQHNKALDGGKVLWYDTNSDMWCVNQFWVRGDTVEVAPMPSEEFEIGRK